MNKEHCGESTLFDADWYARSDPKQESTYPLRLEGEWVRRESEVHDETELSIFEHVIEHETEGYESRGYLSGPIEIVTRYTDPTVGRMTRSSKSIILPTVADPQYIEFRNCRATGLLLIENTPVFHSLVESPAIQELGLLLITGCGVPRLTARKLIHRLNVELGIRIHLLTDNDTWGYFIYSLLLRGAMAPHAHFPWAAVDEVNYLGIRAGDCERFNIREKCFRSWKDTWTPRLNALRKYECFQSDQWQEELNNFEKQNYAVNVTDFVDAVGGADAFVSKFIVPRL